MNRSFFSAVVAATLTIMANTAIADLNIADCSFPEPPVVPDGTTASGDDMVAASKQVKEFVATTETKLKCLDEAKAAAGEEITPEELETYTNTYNGQVDQLNQIANGFNEQVRVFKARD